MGSLKVVGSSLLFARSVVRFRSVVSGSRCINTNGDCGRADANCPRSLLSFSNLYDIFNQFQLFRSSYISIPTLRIRPTRSHESSECLCFYMNMNGVAHDMVQVSVRDNHVTVEGVLNDHGCRMYSCSVDVPKNIGLYKIIDMKAEMNDQGELKLTVPKFKPQEMMKIQRPLKPDERIFCVKVNAID